MGWCGFLLDDGLRHLKPLLIEMIAVSKAVSLDACPPRGNLPRDAWRIRLSLLISEVAIVHPRRHSNFPWLAETHFHLRPFADLVLPGACDALGPWGLSGRIVGVP